MFRAKFYGNLKLYQPKQAISFFRTRCRPTLLGQTMVLCLRAFVVAVY